MCIYSLREGLDFPFINWDVSFFVFRSLPYVYLVEQKTCLHRRDKAKEYPKWKTDSGIEAVTPCDSLQPPYTFTFTVGKTPPINHCSFLTTGCDRYGWLSRHKNEHRESVWPTFIKTVSGRDNSESTFPHWIAHEASQSGSVLSEINICVRVCVHAHTYA